MDLKIYNFVLALCLWFWIVTACLTERNHDKIKSYDNPCDTWSNVEQPK